MDYAVLCNLHAYTYIRGTLNELHFEEKQTYVTLQTWRSWRFINKLSSKIMLNVQFLTNVMHLISMQTAVDLLREERMGRLFGANPAVGVLVSAGSTLP